MASRADFAAHIGVTKPKVDDLIHRGIIREHKALDGIDLDEAQLSYIKQLRFFGSANYSGFIVRRKAARLHVVEKGGKQTVASTTVKASPPLGSDKGGRVGTDL